jgi:hypothetical protein
MIVSLPSVTLDFQSLRSEAHDLIGLCAGRRTVGWQSTAFVDNQLKIRRPEVVFAC